MRIYICDDNELDRERIGRMLTVYAGRFKSRLKIWKFQNAGQMLAAAKKGGTKPDLVFLDIYMEEMDGIRAGEELKNLFAGEIPVIFSTSSGEHAIQAFWLRAVGYLHKPYTQKEFDHALNRLEGMFRESGRYLELRDSEREGIRKVWLEDILWLESEGRGTRFCLADSSEYTDGTLYTAVPLKNFRESLSRNPDFYECGRSCILNLAWADGMVDDGIRMKNGALAAVPVRLRAEARERLESWKKEKASLYLR